MRYGARYIVSDDHEFVYFVVQKVACTSIKNALLPFFDADSMRQDGTSGGIHRLYADSNNQINKNLLVEKLNSEYRDYFKFAFVRNPWDRLVSCYLQRFTGKEAGLNQHDYNGVNFHKGMSFTEFVEAVHEIPDAEANPHFRSQYEVICGPGKDRPIMADFVGRYENLAQDFEVVSKKIGNGQRLSLPHLLPSKSREGRPYAEFYDDRLRRLVRERFREDIEIFDYSF